VNDTSKQPFNAERATLKANNTIPKELKISFAANLQELVSVPEFYENMLRSKEFAAFDPFIEFSESFCTTSICEHRQYIEEMKKEIIGRVSNGGSIYEIWDDVCYRSPHLEVLREERDRRNGLSFNEFYKVVGRKIWKKELDTCEANRVRFQCENYEQYSHLESKVKQKRATIVSEEYEKHFKQRDVDNSRSTKYMYGLVVDVIKSNLNEIGFRYEEKRSSKYYIVFTKKINDEYIFYLRAEFPGGIVLGNSVLQVHLDLRRSRFKRNALLHEDIECIVPINFKCLVNGFWQGYSLSFESAQELAVMVKANMCLILFVDDMLERITHKVLGLT